MSADNCVAILITTDHHRYSNGFWDNVRGIGGITAFRVAHIQSFDSFDWLESNEIHNLGHWMYEMFHKSEVYYNINDAYKQATSLEDELDYTEYGILEIDASKYNYPM